MMASSSAVRKLGLSAIVVVAATACLLLVNVIASVRPVRIDATQSGELRLSPRTTAMLEGLDGTYGVILAIDQQNTDPRTLERLVDVLDAFRHASDRVEVEVIDQGSPGGRAQGDALVARLAARDSAAVGAARALAQQAGASQMAAADALDAIAGELNAIGASIEPGAPGGSNNRAYFEQRAALSRQSAAQMRELGELGASSLDGSAGEGLADTNALLEPGRKLAQAAGGQLGELSEQLAQIARADGFSPSAQRRARELSGATGRLRDRLSVLADEIGRAEPLDALSVGRALRTGETMLVIGPRGRGVRAIDLDALLPATGVIEQAGGSAGAYARERGEGLLAAAIGSLANPDRPIVVFTHGEPRAGLLGTTLTAKLELHLAQRGIDALEWAPVVEPDPPSTTPLDPGGVRPVVYVSIGPDTTGGSAGDDALTGVQRAGKLADALGGVIDDGGRVLLSLGPSIEPGYGGTDPLAALGGAFGMAADTGRPLLVSTVTAQGTAGIATEHMVIARGDIEHPIGGAIAGLPVLLSWPVVLTPTGTARVHALLELDGSPPAWGESQWLSLWKTPRASRHLLGELPEFDDTADAQSEHQLVAAACERKHRGASQRLVVVGSNGWMLDPMAQQLTGEQGRAVLTHPGNLELFDAAVSWLAGQDDQIAPSIAARRVALVRPLDAGAISGLRWGLVLGLPGLILGVGLVWRVVRG